MRLVLILVVALYTAVAPDEHRVRGVVTDDSGAVLPGVTVVATAADGHVLATTVTDGAGRYVLGPLTAGRVVVTFTLEGFSPAALPTTIGDEDVVTNQRLTIAPQSETVQVVGRVPVPPPAPAPDPVHVPPFTFPVPEHDRDSVCGPAKLESPPESFGTVQSRRYAANGLYSQGDELVIDGGIANGVRVGRNFVVRRTFQPGWDAPSAEGEHTAGLVQIVAADFQTAVAVVIYACDEMLRGDRLASFRPEERRPPQPAGTPDYRHAARILFPDVGQIVGAPRRMMVIDRGATAGLCPGQRVTLFRRRAGGREPLVVGDARVVAVRTLSATIRVEHVRDAIFEGDWAAIER